MDLESARMEIVKWNVGAQLGLYDYLDVDSRVLQKMPSRALLRKDFYQKWRELPEVSLFDVPAEVRQVVSPIDYSERVRSYPGFEYSREPMSNTEWFNQEAVRKAYEFSQKIGSSLYSSEYKVVTEVNLLVPLKFVVLSYEDHDVQRKIRVKYRGELVLEMSVKSGGLPRVLLMFDGPGCIKVEICGTLDKLKKQGCRLTAGDCVTEMSLEAYVR